MNANTFLTLSTETQNELLEESRREGWFFETEHGALDADAMEEWLLAERSEETPRLVAEEMDPKTGRWSQIVDYGE